MPSLSNLHPPPPSRHFPGTAISSGVNSSSSSMVPLELALPIPLFIAYVALYHTIAPLFDSEKKRAYVLSVATSACMTLMSLPFTASYLRHGLAVAFEQAQDGWRAEVVRFGTVLFGVYLVADLGIGYVKYRSQIGMLTGWIHHTVYAFLMGYLLCTRLAPVFMIGAILELPTFDLGISTLFPAVRSDERFLSSFLLIRILFHAKLLLDCARPSARRIMDDSWVPTVSLTLALLLHISWFQAGLAGYMKRRRANGRAGSRISASSKSSTNLSPDGTTMSHTTTLSSVPEADESGIISDSDPQTPDDSPLVTPRTPSGSSPFPLGALTNLSLPSIPSMPLPPALTMFATKLPRTAMDMQSGFKEAVRSRWEGQRERFEGVGMRGGVRILRRRRVVEEEDGDGGQAVEVSSTQT